MAEKSLAGTGGFYRRVRLWAGLFPAFPLQPAFLHKPAKDADKDGAQDEVLEQIAQPAAAADAQHGIEKQGDDEIESEGGGIGRFFQLLPEAVQTVHIGSCCLYGIFSHHEALIVRNFCMISAWLREKMFIFCLLVFRRAEYRALRCF